MAKTEMIDMRMTKPSFDDYVKSQLTSPSSLDPITASRCTQPVKINKARNTFQARANSITVVPREPTE